MATPCKHHTKQCNKPWPSHGSAIGKFMPKHQCGQEFPNGTTLIWPWFVAWFCGLCMGLQWFCHALALALSWCWHGFLRLAVLGAQCFACFCPTLLTLKGTARLMNHSQHCLYLMAPSSNMHYTNQKCLAKPCTILINMLTTTITALPKQVPAWSSGRLQCTRIEVWACNMLHP